MKKFLLLLLHHSKEHKEAVQRERKKGGRKKDHLKRADTYSNVPDKRCNGREGKGKEKKEGILFHERERESGKEGRTECIAHTTMEREEEEEEERKDPPPPPKGIFLFSLSVRLGRLWSLEGRSW